MRELEEEVTAEQAVLLGKNGAGAGAGVAAASTARSPSTISPRWICASAWCFPPSA